METTANGFSKGICYLVLHRKVIELKRNENNLWVDDKNTIYAIPEKALSIDENDKCGVGFLSTPSNWTVNRDCKVHDYMYSSPAYQFFNTREDADQYLEKLIENDRQPILAKVFYFLARKLGFPLWENKKTNN